MNLWLSCMKRLHASVSAAHRKKRPADCLRQVWLIFPLTLKANNQQFASLLRRRGVYQDHTRGVRAKVRSRRLVRRLSSS